MLITLNVPDNLPHERVQHQIREIEENLRREAKLFENGTMADGISRSGDLSEKPDAVRPCADTAEVSATHQTRPDDYSALDELIGICETNRTDASVNHDRIIYGKGDTDDLR